jgi:hypothetical protein
MKNNITPEDIAKYRAYKAGKPQKNEKELGLMDALGIGENIAKGTAKNFGKGVAQGAINAAPSTYNLAARGANALTGSNLKPFPYKADFVDPEAMGAGTGEFLGSMFMPGVGGAGKLAEKALTKSAPYLSKILGGATSGAVAGGGAQATLNPDAPIDPYAMILPALLGGAVGAVGGAPEAGANAYLGRARRLAEQNPATMNSPQQVGELAKRFPENSIDLPSLVGDKTASNIYSKYLGVMPFSGVRKAEERAMAAQNPEAIRNTVKQTAASKESANQSMWKGFEKKVEDLNITNNHESLFKGLDKKYGTYKKSENPYEKISKKYQLSETSKKQLNEKAKKEGITLEGLSDFQKRQLIKEARIPALKSMHLQGDKLSDSIKLYQELGEMVRSTKNASKKTRVKDAQNLVKSDIEESLKKSGRDDLVKEWESIRTHHRENIVPLRAKPIQKIIKKPVSEQDALKTLTNPEYVDARRLLGKEGENAIRAEQALSTARGQEGSSFGWGSAKKLLGSPSGKAAEIALLSTGGFLSPTGGAAALATNIGANTASKIARSSALRDAYVSGKGVDAKGLGKEIFPIWMRALGAGAKQAPKAIANTHANGERQRRENEDYY